jgi:hypothetical protein
MPMYPPALTTFPFFTMLPEHCSMRGIDLTKNKKQLYVPMAKSMNVKVRKKNRALKPIDLRRAPMLCDAKWALLEGEAQALL